MNWDVVNGVLLTANSIFKRFRYVQRSDALYADILYVLNLLQEPLTKLFLGLIGLLETGDKKVECLEALRSVCRIFYSLNYQVRYDFECCYLCHELLGCSILTR